MEVVAPNELQNQPQQLKLEPVAPNQITKETKFVPSLGMIDYSNSVELPDMSKANTYQPSYVNPIMGTQKAIDTQITGVSPIMNPNITISTNDFEAISNSVLYPTDYIEKYLGVDALRPKFDKLQETIQNQLQNSQDTLDEALKQQDPNYYKTLADSTLSNSSNPFSPNNLGIYNYKDNLPKLIGMQESQGTGGYKAFNSTSNALGKYQITKDTLFGESNRGNGWAKEALDAKIIDKIPTQEEFLNSPDIQDKVAKYQMGKMYDNAKLLGASDTDAVKYVSASWYNTENKGRIVNKQFVHLPIDSIKQGKNGEYPSVIDYTNQVTGRIRTEEGVNNNSLPQQQKTPLTNAQSEQIPQVVKNFFNDWEGKAIPNPTIKDGSWAGECVALALRYYKDVMRTDVPAFGAYAKDGLYDGVLDKQFDNINPNKLNVGIKLNDMVFQGANKNGTGYAGHVGIAVTNSDSQGYFTIMESNVNGKVPSYRVLNKSVIDGLRRLKT